MLLRYLVTCTLACWPFAPVNARHWFHNGQGNGTITSSNVAAVTNVISSSVVSVVEDNQVTTTARNAEGTTTVSASTPAASATSTSTAETSASDCSCGYVLSSYGDVYFTTLTSVNMASLSSVNDLEDKYTFVISDGWATGGTAPDGTTCEATRENVKLVDGVLELIVPGGQTASGPLSVTGAEISWPAVTYGVFTMSAMPQAIAGSCQSIFTYHAAIGSDEQDIELLGASMLQASDIMPEGISLTNWNPSGSGNNATVPAFPSDPTTSYHDYTIAWTSTSTSYYFDTTALKSPTEYSSINPSQLLLNNWSNGDSRWTQGPPTDTATLKIAALTFYTGGDGTASSLPSGCTLSQACAM